ncbi:MAG: response regulator [Spirochaetaceae bacterium]|nr:response regulator [Spirochaetaceae bacterium]
MNSRGAAESLGHGYYWVGSQSVEYGLQCNPYLLVDEGGSVLFDPGSMLDVDEVVEKTSSILPLSEVKYVVLHHQDPDLAAAVPRLESLGMRFTVVTHWRTWSIARYYGIKSSVYLTNEHGNSLTLPDGRRLTFISTPYLHFSGSMVTWDKGTGYLLSSDLFSALSPTWSLYAGPDYMEGMKTYHENYMPSNDLLKPVMGIFSSLNISVILPQHGSVIRDNPQAYIDVLSGLECGTFSRPKTIKSRSKTENYIKACEGLLARFLSLYGADTLKELTASLDVVYEETTRQLGDFAISGKELWNLIAGKIYLMKGAPALVVLETLVANLCAEFNVEKPEVYTSFRSGDGHAAADLAEEIAKLKEENTELLQSIGNTQDILTKDAATGLYNEAFFRNYIDEEASLMLGNEGVEDDVLAIIGLDDVMARIEYRYGPSEVEAILKNVARIITDEKKATQLAFRLHGATFALWMPHILFHEAEELCDSIRKKVKDSKSFIEPVTVSAGIAALVEIRDSIADTTKAGQTLTDIGIRRLRLARRSGGNTICASSEIEKEARGKARILIADDDAINTDVVRTFLENADYQVFTAADGDEALRKVNEEGVDLVISELMIPKIDGFKLKELMSQRSGTKDIPFVLFSHLKDETSVIRAYDLGINCYLKKPFLLAELLGVVQNLTAVAGGR